jgi:predicted PurR-regulated permease PerM
MGRWFLQLGLFLLALWAIAHLYPLLLYVFLAFTLAAALDPAVRFLNRLLPYPSAVIAAYLAVFGLLFLGAHLASPLLLAQFRYLAGLIPEARHWLEANLGFAVGDLAGSLAASAKAAGGLLVRVGEVVSEMVLALILAVMISLEPHLVQRIAPYLPCQGWERVLEDTWHRMGYWARAQFLIALSFALLMGGWLFLLGVPSPFALGLLGGLLEVIPFVGGITTALLASLLAFPERAPSRRSWSWRGTGASPSWRASSSSPSSTAAPWVSTPPWSFWPSSPSASSSASSGSSWRCP